MPAFYDAPLRSSVPFATLIIFTLFTFANIPTRFTTIGAIRPTLILIALQAIFLAANWGAIRERLAADEGKWILRILFYIVVSLPFVKWPGSVIGKNFEIFLRSCVFYFFVAAFVDSVPRLRCFMFVFICSQVFRCLEPLYLHETTGYWGEFTYFSYQSMMRLAGAPSDIVGANGLAFVVVTVLPFLHYWATQRRSFARIAAYAIIGPLLIYVLILTASRSGMVALGVDLLGVIWFSPTRARWLGALAIGVILVIPHLSENQRDRYVSLVDHSAKQSGSAEGRISGWSSNFGVFLERPIFGYGVGTSQEADSTVAGDTNYAHNLYLEVLIELGVVGFALFIGYLLCIWRSSRQVLREVVSRQHGGAAPLPDILIWLPKALLVWLAMCLFFSLASFGFSEYEWYLFGALVTVTVRLTRTESTLQGAPQRGDVSLAKVRRPNSARSPRATPSVR